MTLLLAYHLREPANHLTRLPPHLRIPAARVYRRHRTHTPAAFQLHHGTLARSGTIVRIAT